MNVLLVSKRKSICSLMCTVEIFYLIVNLPKSKMKVNFSLGNRKYPSIVTEFSEVFNPKDMELTV